jgi:hypothetical protein
VRRLPGVLLMVVVYVIVADLITVAALLLWVLL